MAILWTILEFKMRLCDKTEADKTNNGIENWHCNSSSTSIKMSITAKIK